ncbi:hypothetical protein OsccyDRAFT_1330 [Leptolyngbyaceae cyanobacterium JSC-12]|nr:hypothetical protein OsccyDRAFT_1330 [Leptolyngbyaceae cyanobacterium JSC-12]
MNSHRNKFIKEYLCVFIFFWALFALVNHGRIVGEGEYHYRLAEHIIKTGELGFKVSQNHYLFYKSPNGNEYLAHEIGNTLLMLPTAFVNLNLEKLLSGFVSLELITKLKSFILSFQFGVYSAITVTAFYGILRSGFQQTISISFLGTLSLAITTYFLDHTRQSFDIVLCCTLLTSSFLFLLLYKHQHARGNLFLVAAFLCLGFAFITRKTVILSIFASFLYLFLLHRNSLRNALNSFLIAVATLAPFFIWQLWYNQLRTGNIFRSPVTAEVYDTYNALDGNILVGLAGLLFSPGKSLFIYAPLLILSVFLFSKFQKQHPKEAIYVLTVAGLWLLLHARLRSWYGAWGWGPRHFIAVLPIFLIPFVVNLEYVLRKPRLRFFAGMLAAFGLILSLASIISDFNFRLHYAEEQGRLDDSIFIWGFWHSQPVDMLRAAAENIWRMFTGGEIIKTKLSPEGNYVASTLNVWANGFIEDGIPWFVVAAALLPLIVLLVATGSYLVKLMLQSDAPSLTSRELLRVK